MQIILDAETQELIEQRFSRGDFGSPSELIRAAIASLDIEDPLSTVATPELQRRYPGLHDAIIQGLSEADAGNLSDGEEFFAEPVATLGMADINGD